MTLVERFEQFVIRGPGCWIWTGPRSSNGRPIFKIAGRRFVAARLAIELYREEVPSGLCACHSCDNGECVNPDHLWLGTHAENMADAARKGRMHRGCAAPNAKLTEDQVREIFRLYDANEISVKEIAERFGVKHATIDAIVRGWNWGHLGLKATPRGRGTPKARQRLHLHPELALRGEAHPRAKFSDDQVEEVRRLGAEGKSLRMISRATGISFTQIRRILGGVSRREAPSAISSGA